MHYLRDVRLIPLVLFATVALFALKTVGLLVAGRYVLEPSVFDDAGDVTGSIGGGSAAGGSRPAGRQSWAQEVLGYPDATGSVSQSKTAETKAPPKPGGKPEEPKENARGWKPVALEGGRPSPAETAILERLQERRNEIDARNKDIEMRESLLKAAEKRLEGRIGELKDIESRLTTTAQQREEQEAVRFKNVVTMYENMKAKEAAKIFDRLDLKILVEVATQINPRRMSDIMAQMSPDAAERLTVELAARAKDKPAELPKIGGRPNGN
jgi:flagellar motility protein MotE (MotC chaperone)